MDVYTCVSCRVAFKDGEFQRLHYKSDWHRYNLKRKVAELPPITAEEFQRRVILQRSENESNLRDKSVYCVVCRKSFGNQNAYDNHLNSKKHKDNIKVTQESDDTEKPVCQTENLSAQPKHDLSKASATEAEEGLSDSEVEELDSDEWDDDIENPIDKNNCLFCDHHSKTLLKNIKHMSVAHSFFIPDVEYCVDIRGLLSYLGEKINSGYMCLWCNEKGRTFRTADAARSHMLDKGHCKMLHDGLALAEYTSYYDYSASYPDKDQDVDVDDEVEIPELDGTEYQLVLPSGVVIGHRSLMRYYKQNIDPFKAVVVSKSNKKLHKVLAGYKALGWTTAEQEAVARKARDIHHLKRLQSKYYMKLGVKHNKFQPHFRQQVNY